MDYPLFRVLPEVPPGRCAGVDWGHGFHAVCVVDANGKVADRFTVGNDKAGLEELVSRLRRDDARECAIERGDGPVAGVLLAAGITVVVIPPGRTAGLRSRHVSSGAKDDDLDALVLADALRTDRARLRPLVPDTPATVALRAATRFRKELVWDKSRVCERLRSHLRSVFPGAIGLFSVLDRPISLTFLDAFPSWAAAQGLDEAAMGEWLRTVPARGGTSSAAVLAGRLAAAAPGCGDPVLLEPVTRQMAAAAAGFADQIRAMEAEITLQLAVHPDAHIFTSLPGTAAVRAARLLSEIGDCRARFPSDGGLAAAAGVCPVTRRSGKREAHFFRWTANKHLRDAVCDFADGSRRANAWAASVYDEARERGKDHPHAIRILARAWIRIIWRCWQDGVPYDPAKHKALQDILARRRQPGQPEEEQ